MQHIRKPLTARSVLASVLLGTEPAWLPTRLLVRTAELFGIAEGAVRTALSRMVSAGEARPRDGGYELAGHLLERQERQRAGRRADTGRWDGRWDLAVIATEGRRPAAERAALRTALVQLHLAELREGVWARPANLDPHRQPAARAVADGQVEWWHGAAPPDGLDVDLLWDLTAWAATTEQLRAEMAEHLPRLEQGDTGALAAGFLAAASVVRHLQADPLLPSALLPDDWPGDDLRREYDRYDAAYRSVLRGWFADHG